MRALLWAGALTTLAACACDVPVIDPPPVQPVGSVRVDVSGSSATLVLVGLEQPLRAFEVDIDVDEGNASAVTPIADHDVVEAGLGGDQGGKAHFTVVVGDTRRLPLQDGPLVVLSIDEGATPVLSGAAGVDQQGVKRALTVVAP